jgi:hypothetical protein
MSTIFRAWIVFVCVIATLPSKAMSEEPPSTFAFNSSVGATLDAISALNAFASSHAGSQQIHFVPNSYKFWTNPRFATTHLISGCTG